MPFIVGVPRSGTTLLRFMLDAHPLLAIPPETGFVAGPLNWYKFIAPRAALFRAVTGFPLESGAWLDFGLEAREFREELRKLTPFDLGEGIRAFYRLYARNQNKPRYGDKTPLYCARMAAIEKLLPEARFVHIIRDGRDVALSLRPMWFAPGQDIRTLALYWRRLIQDARAAGRHCRAYMEVHFEELVADPLSALYSICSFLSLDFDPAMLRYWERTPERLQEHKSRTRWGGHARVTREERLLQQELTTLPLQPKRVSRWKTEMTQAECDDFLRYAGETLEELGYERL